MNSRSIDIQSAEKLTELAKTKIYSTLFTFQGSGGGFYLSRGEFLA